MHQVPSINRLFETIHQGNMDGYQRRPKPSGHRRHEITKIILTLKDILLTFMEVMLTSMDIILTFIYILLTFIYKILNFMDIILTSMDIMLTVLIRSSWT